jgi:NADH dehydrogenase FAD-containing subunit
VDAFPGKQVTIVHSGPRLLSRGLIPPTAISYAHSYLTSQGVEVIVAEKVIEQRGILVTAIFLISASTFVTDQGRTVYADLAFLCTGIKSNADILKPDYEESLDSDGFALVNEHLQLKGNKNIFVAGELFLDDY